MQKIDSINELKKKSLSLRIEVIKMLEKAQSGHVGGAFGMADFVTTLYYSFANLDPANPTWEGRDYILLSNGHTCPIIYAALGDLGFFPKEEWQHLREINHLLQGHPNLTIPGIENSSGPLGHGLSQAIGIALGLKLDKKPNRVFCMVSDGEQQEGQNWEAAMSVHKWNLDNLTVIMEHNGIQIEGTNDQIMPNEHLGQKYTAFGWKVIYVDGNNIEAIKAAYVVAVSDGAPSLVICKTTAGKGVDYMEGKFAYHDWKGAPGEAESAIAQLEAALVQLG
jgi:transketolase